MKQIGENRQEYLLAECHQSFNLEGLEAIVIQSICFCIEKSSERTGDGVTAQGIPKGMVLDRVDEIGDRTSRRRTAGKKFESAPERLSMLRKQSDILDSQKQLKPVV